MAIQINARSQSRQTVDFEFTRIARAPRLQTAPVAEDTVKLSDDTASPKEKVDRAILLKTLGVKPTETNPPEPIDTDPPEPSAGYEAVAARLRVEVETSTEVQVRVEDAEDPERQDPLVLDLDGDGEISLTPVDEGVAFDINADGRLDRTAFVSGGDGLLALDRNGDGQISSGAELFGDATGARDGFADLARLDDNADGVIDRSDSAFEQLRVLDGRGSLRSLTRAGVESISLASRRTGVERADGNAELAEGQFRRTDGRVGRVADVLLAYQSMTALAG